MTPEDLWQFKEVIPLGISKTGKQLFYQVKTPHIKENDFDTKSFKIDISGGEPLSISEKEIEDNLRDKKLSPDGQYKIFYKKVHIKNRKGADVYKDLPQTASFIIDSLDYKHWDKFNEGDYNHLFYRDLEKQMEIDIMPNEPYYTPQEPFGGEEDFTWDEKGENIFYACKKEEGTAYAVSTNTDIYKYNLKTRKTENISFPNPGYDTRPAVSKQGTLAWLEMETAGYEADKNDLILLKDGKKINITRSWDGTVLSFLWSEDGRTIYFVAPIAGTKQVFRIKITDEGGDIPEQLTKGDYDIKSIIAEADGKLFLLREDLNHPSEIFSYNIEKADFQQLTFENKLFPVCPSESRIISTRDGHKMLIRVIFPPDFDPQKQYPALLYCQGGPQSPLTQFYSRRWNFQLIASQGYIVVAPNRRGMPGHGVEWNRSISKNWGAAMQDYLDAIDEVAGENYVDKKRLGAIGASFGGYSVFWLAGNHEGRFKTFIAHDGVFDTRAMYGSTEEVFFPNYDLGGPYWDQQNAAAQKAYTTYNPINYVEKWDTPILIIQGEKDYRVATEQGFGAFQAAQLKGIRSKLLYFSDEGHWVTKPQNGLVWQREFFKWLKETL